MNLDNLEMRVQSAGGNLDLLNAYLLEAPIYSGKGNDARFNDVLAQIMQGLTTSTMTQNGGSLPANFADNTAIKYLKAAKIDLSSEAATPVAKQIKAVINETAAAKSRSVA